MSALMSASPARSGWSACVRGARRLCRRADVCQSRQERAASPMNCRRFFRHFPDPAEETRKMSTSSTDSDRRTSDPTGLHRVLDDPADGRVLPQAARRLDARRELWPDEVRVRVETLNLDAASFRQLEQKREGDGAAVRDEVLAIVAERGKMQNPVTGSGGML